MSTFKAIIENETAKDFLARQDSVFAWLKRRGYSVASTTDVTMAYSDTGKDTGDGRLVLSVYRMKDAGHETYGSFNVIASLSRTYKATPTSKAFVQTLTVKKIVNDPEELRNDVARSEALLLKTSSASFMQDFERLGFKPSDI